MTNPISIAVAVAAIAVPAVAEPMPYPKTRDQCAGSYVQSGGFCVPRSGGTVRAAVPKPAGAQCPAGWVASGGACERR
jgi:hypothetical protein